MRRLGEGIKPPMFAKKLLDIEESQAYHAAHSRKLR
jgi:hypothetical protein